VQDRRVLGGYFIRSANVDLWCSGSHNKETGILEEIQLKNCYRNSLANYSIWDSALYEKAYYCPNLMLMLNTLRMGGFVKPNFQEEHNLSKRYVTG